MGKIEFGKSNGFGPIRSERQKGLNRSSSTIGASFEGKTSFSTDDTVALSGKGSEVGVLVDTLRTLPDVREAKVVDYREQISAGRYQPSSEKIADAILREERF